MPFHDESLKLEQLKKMAYSHRCNECAGLLTVAWGGAYGINGYVLKCSNPEHSTVAPKGKTATPGVETYQEYIRREIEMEQRLGPETSRALAPAPRTGRLTQNQAMQILKLVYPRAPESEIVRCAMLCRDFGLHPLMKEVYIIPFGVGDKKTWTTVVGITANRKMAADRKGTYSFIDDTPRAASQEEIIKQFGKDSEEAKDNIISICKVRGKDGNEAIGFGLWPKAKEPYGMDKGNTKRNMCNIRAERQCLDRLPGAPLPQAIDVIDEVYADVPTIYDVDETTGEIKEPKPKKSPKPAVQPEPEVPEDAPQQATEAVEEEAGDIPFGKAQDKPFGKVQSKPKTKPEPGTMKRPSCDPASVKDWNDLCKACHTDFGMDSRQILKELGYSSKMDIGESMEECYRRIVAARCE